MSETVIQIEDLSKSYRLGVIGRKTLSADLNRRWAQFRGKPDPLSKVTEVSTASNGSPKSNSSEEIWALKDISFDVKQGEVLGIIGRNGAGKSTLLKILSRVTAPTKGEVRVKGRIASLLEVGTGFHPELTGRENVFLNGAILGMTKDEIRNKFDEIVAFSEVEKFINTPVKRYSSGMYVRLAFAVAAHLDPEILIIDEVLAVGDAAFQTKCLGKMGEVAREGRTVLFVSHNMGAINSLTQRCVSLNNGQIVAVGPSRRIVEDYLSSALRVPDVLNYGLDLYRRDSVPDSPVKIVGLRLEGYEGEMSALPTITMGVDFTIVLDLDVSSSLHGAHIDISLKTSSGNHATLLFSRDSEYSLFLEPGRHRIAVEVHNLSLSPGNYFIDVGVNKSVESSAYDVILDFPIFTVGSGSRVFHWPNRSWGAVHCDTVGWSEIE